MEGLHITAHKELAQVEGLMDSYLESRPKIDDFEAANEFSSSERKDDKEKCEDKKKNIEEKLRKSTESERNEQMEKNEIGYAAEFALYYAAKEYSWFGKDTKILLTTEYDDLINGVDCVAEFNEKGTSRQHLGLAIDFASSPVASEEKIKNIIRNIDLGQNTKVKYFRSGDKISKNLPVIKIVVGGDSTTSARLMSYMTEIMSSSGISDSIKSEFQKDDFQYIVLGEALIQLDAFRKRLEEVLRDSERHQRREIVKTTKESIAMNEQVLNALQKVIADKKIDLRRIGLKMRGERFASMLLETLRDQLKKPVGSI